MTAALTALRRSGRRGGEGLAVLLIAAVVAALSMVGFVLVTIVALYTMKRLRLDVWFVLEWLGLAESQQPARPPLRPLPTPASRRSAAAPGT